MSRNAHGKRPMGSESRGEPSNAKRQRSNQSFSPEALQEAPTEPIPKTQTSYEVPATKPDIGLKAFLNDYLATHTATDPLFRRSVTTLVEDKFDYEGIDYADQLLDDIKAMGGHHPDMRAVQIISDEELSFKWARLLMSLTLDAGNLPTIMRYLGKISAEKFGVELNDKFETAVQSFLVQVGHTSVDATNASSQRQMSIMPTDAHEETGGEGSAREQHLDITYLESSDKDERLKLFKSETPIVDLILGRNCQIAALFMDGKQQRKNIMDALRRRADGLKCHRLQVCQLQQGRVNIQDPWFRSLIGVYRLLLADRRDELERVLREFVDGNRCLFPELRRFDLKQQRIKRERA
ncbi:hypothetical protein Vi05172_g2867 [Venturia inaequalis]|uniref:Uncharacterized protein n=1 Tax=Venturia inaequalis TaxID=5025 RepID=A0A8H3VCA6_VENIN|nr:hypothetical protein EG327_004471 [Venturia inaequalis]RDI87119.1 hypothetical protein Vi05172_g2867 [Venturia inaequalis]